MDDRERVLTLQDIQAIPDALLPMMALVDNPLKVFGFGIKIRTHGLYSHFMWLHRRSLFATQDWWFRTFPVDHYAGYTIKLVLNPDWGVKERAVLAAAIQERLDLPWWKTRYDALAILGKAVGWNWLQVPWLDICSDSADILQQVDPRYNLVHPDPGQVNAWTKTHKRIANETGATVVPGYQVYGRYHAGD